MAIGLVCEKHAGEPPALPAGTHVLLIKAQLHAYIKLFVCINDAVQAKLM